MPDFVLSEGLGHDFLSRALYDPKADHMKMGVRHRVKDA